MGKSGERKVVDLHTKTQHIKNFGVKGKVRWRGGTGRQKGLGKEEALM